ncbi:MAG: leucyl-tRNA--protein transferase [Treponemataceae bacterium]
MQPALILPGDDPDAVVDELVAARYEQEFCVSPSFDPYFIASLMGAGFLVMSARIPGISHAVLLPKLHRERSIIEFEDLHESRSVQRVLDRFELRFNSDFDEILNKCVETHGDDWLTDELTAAFRIIHTDADTNANGSWCDLCSFALYRDGILVAGEFGVVAGGVYTSYSGYRRENSAGTAQLALTGRFLRQEGFAFWDLGMPLDYKTRLGAKTLRTADFVERFRRGRMIRPRLL